MIDNLPLEIFAGIASELSQEDKTSLSYVSRALNERIIPILYENIFLNERPFFPSDLDNTLGTNFWSVLYFRSAYNSAANIIKSRSKFKLLLRSLRDAPFRLCPLIRRVHCSWHLDRSTLIEFIKVLMRHGENLRYFSNILDLEISKLLLPRASQLHCLDIAPPTRIPGGPADNMYYGKLEVMLNRYDWYRIKKLTLHVNPCTFFPHLESPLKIHSLCLNLRPDTYNGTFLEQPYYKIFDPETLKDLEILSWYKTDESNISIYRQWNLHHFFEFANVKSLTILSLVSNEPFLRKCFESFTALTRLKVDFMFDVPFSQHMVDFLAQVNTSRTMEYIHVTFDDTEALLISLNPEEPSSFKLNLTCKCQNCWNTFNEVLLSKIFPTTESLSIKNFNDVESIGYYLHMFKCNPIVPYTHFVDRTPAIGFQCSSLTDHAGEINNFTKKNGTRHTKAITSYDVLRLYHAHIHSMKKIYDSFLNKFSNLKFLTLNDIPTKIIQIDELQRCNVPVFYSKNYISNQVYELVTSESLFD